MKHIHVDSFTAKWFRIVVGGFCAALMLTAGTAQGQYTADSQTNTIDGVVSNWMNRPIYYVGSNYVYDALQVINGGVLSNWTTQVGTYGNSNSVLVSGNGSALKQTDWIDIGYYGSGNSAVVSNGGVLAVASPSINTVGHEAGSSNNSVRVTGNGSIWSSRGPIYVGNYGSGNSLVIDHGGQVWDSIGTVGHWSGGQNNRALITDEGSVWSNYSIFNVGHRTDSSSLIISNGGKVISGNGRVGGVESASNNSVVVTGTGSVWSNQTILYVGGLATGNTLAISDGGSVVSSNVVVSTANSLVLNGGSLTAPGGVLVSNNAILRGTGTIFADLTLAGTLAPGNSPGVITNFGNLTLQTSAVLDMQLGGTMQGSQYDFILVTNGTVTLDGLLQVSFINGFASSVSSNDTFVLLQGDSPLGGSFTNVISGYVTTAGGEGTFYVYYSNNAVTLSGYQAIVPEPSTMALCAVALLTLFGARRKIASRRT